MDREGLRSRIVGIINQGVLEETLELVDVEVSGSAKSLKIAVFIDKPGGVSIDDCAKSSREIEARIDENDFIPVSYVLEVSSPGLNRELKKASDFDRFVGSLIKVRIKDAIEGQRNFLGRLVSVSSESFALQDKTSGHLELRFDQVAKANLEIDLEEELKRK